MQANHQGTSELGNSKYILLVQSGPQQREACSWKGQLESLNLVSFGAVGKSQAKLERTDRSWKVSLEMESFAAVRKFLLKLESLNENGKL